MRRVYKILNQFKPDVIQLYSLHGYYLDIYGLFEYIHKHNIPTVYGMMDEYAYMGYCCYGYDCEGFKDGCYHCQRSFKKIYPASLFFNRARKTIELKAKAYNFEKIIFTGPQWLVNRAKESYLLKDKCVEVIDSYIDTKNTFSPKKNEEIRTKLKLEDKKIILNVAPSSDGRKGTKYFIEVARQITESEYCFIHVGYSGDTSGLPANYIPVPFIKNQQELAEYYSVADLFMCTSMADAMPNTCLDALACGTPVCGFDISGVPFVAEKPYGVFVEPANVKQLVEIVRKTGKKTEKTIKECREYALSRYSRDAYYHRQMEIYSKLFK